MDVARSKNRRGMEHGTLFQERDHTVLSQPCWHRNIMDLDSGL